MEVLTGGATLSWIQATNGTRDLALRVNDKVTGLQILELIITQDNVASFFSSLYNTPCAIYLGEDHGLYGKDVSIEAEEVTVTARGSDDALKKARELVDQYNNPIINTDYKANVRYRLVATKAKSVVGCAYTFNLVKYIYG